MKRFFTIILCGIMACSMAACAKKQTPQEIYDMAQKKNSELSSMEMTANSTVNMKQKDLEMTQSVNSEIKIDNLNTEKMRYFMTGTTTVAGQTLDMTMFYTDGYYYMETAGQKIKVAMDLDEMTKQMQQNTNISQFSSADFLELTEAQSGNDHVLTYKVDPAKMTDLMESIYKTMGVDESLGGNIKIEEMSGEATVNNKGYYTAMKTYMKLKMTVQGETIYMDLTADSVVKNPGQAVEVTLPSTDGFTEMDASLLGLN